MLIRAVEPGSAGIDEETGAVFWRLGWSTSEVVFGMDILVGVNEIADSLDTLIRDHARSLVMYKRRPPRQEMGDRDIEIDRRFDWTQDTVFLTQKHRLVKTTIAIEPAQPGHLYLPTNPKQWRSHTSMSSS
jgi:hypothetical protein